MPKSSIRIPTELFQRLRRLQGRIMMKTGHRISYGKILEILLTPLSDKEVVEQIKASLPPEEEEEG